MSEYTATIKWQKAEQEDFLTHQYSRAHTWSFDGGITVPASSSPHIVPLPYSEATNVDPEEAFVAALSSCHMLFVLAIAAQRKFIIHEYVDNATGTLEKDSDGKMAMTKVTLRPQITFLGNQPTRQQLEEMHHLSHEKCFIANSVKTEVTTEIIE
ncbi:OsmC family protein [Endozoicomonas sp. SM1973]|uniref:OsmC family protein n=1 Tax=Spartinivicinus marinus TaxID=2994442 RepID=A0A853ID40_9GAMM|nr:OsmC family protein [Spartinivicinus marinus]MCX4028449.1 OsmC family protein [Spartinivicinus marinus]NYZ67437.1 OsmC family protein [Spartinivicinus marinus]